MKLVIDRLGHLGDGVGLDGAGGQVFAPRTLPGEEIEGEVVAGRIEAPAIVTPSPCRRRAPCPHYRQCGGCALMHADDGFVADWKREVIIRALAGQGIEATVLETETSPDRSRRRATLAARRTRGGAIVGFHGRASDAMVPITDCHLLLPEIMGAVPHLARIAAAGGSRKGEMQMVVTACDDGLDLAVSGGKPLEQSLFSALGTLAEEGRLARLSWDGEVVAARGGATQTFGRARVTPPPGAFLQATREGEAALVQAVGEAVGDARRIADLFSGAGTFTLPMAERAAVHAAEGDPALVAALLGAARAAPGLRPVTAETRDLFRRPLLPDELQRFDAVILDPPRAGAEAQCAKIAAARLPVVAYVSCNAQTFARDARMLTAAGYVLDWVRPVDQFRWSTHVELAARFSLAEGRPFKSG